MTASTGADATAMTRAILLGIDYPPPGVADTPENKWLWNAIAKDMDAMPGGVLPDIPWDWTDMPDDYDEPPPEGPRPKGDGPAAAGRYTERLHPRGPGGRFAPKPGGAIPVKFIAPAVTDRLAAIAKGTTSTQVRGDLAEAARRYKTGDWGQATRLMLKAATYLDGLPDWNQPLAAELRQIAASVFKQIKPPPRRATPAQRAAKLAGRLRQEADLAEARIPAAAGNLRHAARVLDNPQPGTDWRDLAAGYVRTASINAQDYPKHRAVYDDLIHQVTNLPDLPAGVPAVGQYAALTAKVLPGLLGGGTEKWDGKVNLFTRDDNPGIAGTMSWDGQLSLLDDTAYPLDRQLTAAAAAPDGTTTVSEWDPFNVLLHEMIHGVEGGRTTEAAKAWDTLPAPDRDVLDSWNAADALSPAGGAYPVAHTLAQMKANKNVTQDRIDQLTEAGLLRDSGTTSSVYNPDTGKSTEPVRSWLLTSKARAMFPQDRYAPSDHIAAYRDPRAADIEEGFTELGTIMHMPGYTQATGVGKWETGMIAEGAQDSPEWTKRKDELIGQMDKARGDLARQAEGPVQSAVWAQAWQHLKYAALDLDNGDDSTTEAAITELRHLGTPTTSHLANLIEAGLQHMEAVPALRHATLAEYATRIADPARIAAGDAYGHYPDKTARALGWVQAVALAEHKRNVDKPGTPGYRRMVELADEINREGPAGKIPAMARQVIRVMTKDPDSAAPSAPAVEQRIRGRWDETGLSRADLFGDARHSAHASAGPVSSKLTPAGQEAEKITAWAWADPEGRARDALAKVNTLARTVEAGDRASLRQVQDAGRMLARLIDGLDVAGSE